MLNINFTKIKHLGEKFIKCVLKFGVTHFVLITFSWLISNHGAGFLIHGKSTQPPIRFEHLFQMFILALIVNVLFGILGRPERSHGKQNINTIIEKFLSRITTLSIILIVWWFHRIPLSNSFLKAYLASYCIGISFTTVLQAKLYGINFRCDRNVYRFVIHFFSKKFNLLLSLFLLSLLLIAFQIKKFPDSKTTFLLKRKFKKARQVWLREETNWKLESIHPRGTYWEPMDVHFFPGQYENYLVLDRRGRLWKHSLKANAKTPELILDCSSILGTKEKVNSDWGASNDGALSFVFHPNFINLSEGRIYIYFSFPDLTDQNQCTLLVCANIKAENTEARFKSIEKLIFTKDPKSNIITAFHSGGGLTFGNEGFLYLGKGDLGRPENAYQIDKKHIGIIRIDVDNQGEPISTPIHKQPLNGVTKGYFIPKDNPFYARKDILPEHYSIGLRNPFRIYYDKKTNDLWVGNVGQNNFEEIELAKPGTNHQWPWKEGPDRFLSYEESQIGIITEPVYAYAHNSIDRSVVIGPVYRGKKYTDLHEKILYADTISGKIRALKKNEMGQWESSSLAQATEMGSYGIVKIISHLDGEIYIVAKGESKTASGTIYKLIPGTDNKKIQSEFTPEQRFSQLCSVCHGNDGQGEKTFISQIGKKMPDFTDSDWQTSKTNEWIRDVITKGGGAMQLNIAMPSWKEILTKNEIDDLVSYIRSMAKAK